MSSLKLYAAPQSSPSRFLVSIFKQLEIEFEYINVDIYKGEQKAPEYLGINPNGKVPVINDDGFILFESWAIARYILLNKAPENTIYPKDDIKKRAQIDMLVG